MEKSAAIWDRNRRITLIGFSCFALGTFLMFVFYAYMEHLPQWFGFASYIGYFLMMFGGLVFFIGVMLQEQHKVLLWNNYRRNIVVDQNAAYARKFDAYTKIASGGIACLVLGLSAFISGLIFHVYFLYIGFLLMMIGVSALILTSFLWNRRYRQLIQKQNPQGYEKT